MKRRIYVGAAVALAMFAALLTLRAQHTVPVLVANANVPAGAQLTDADVRVVSIHDDSVPAGALTGSESATGRWVAWPLTAGEPVLGQDLSSSRSGSDVVSGYTVPAGYRAVAIPITPAAAVGGMLTPDDRVDVYATPNGQSGSSSSSAAANAEGAPPSPTTLLGHDLLVLQLRSDQGQPLTSSSSSDTNVHGLNFNNGKLGSVVVAVPNADVVTFATAASTDTMYVALSIS